MNKINDLKRIEQECKLNMLLHVVTGGDSPSLTIFRRFFTESNPLVLKKLFLYTVVELNDYGYVNFLKLYIDSTDALVRGSRNYIITKFKVESFEFLEKHDLIHDVVVENVVETSII